jgi:hypothetical protein
VLGKDPDLYHAPLIIRHSEDIRHKVQHSYQTFSFIITWLVGVPLGLITHGISQALTKDSYNRVVKFGKNKHLNADSLRTRQGLYIFLVHIIPFLLHGLSVKAFLFSVIPIYLYSLCFMINT